MRLERKDVSWERKMKVRFGISDWGIYTLTMLSRLARRDL